MFKIVNLGHLVTKSWLRLDHKIIYTGSCSPNLSDKCAVIVAAYEGDNGGYIKISASNLLQGNQVTEELT